MTSSLPTSDYYNLALYSQRNSHERTEGAKGYLLAGEKQKARCLALFSNLYGGRVYRAQVMNTDELGFYLPLDLLVISYVAWASY